jgi:hypothetical protein
MEDQLNVWPVWLLPMRNIPAPQSLFASPKNLPSHLCNVGVYGIPGKKYRFEAANKLLESTLAEHNGRKVYYSHAFYDRNYFYNQLYEGKAYFALRKDYHADGCFPEIYDKIITKNGQL